MRNIGDAQKKLGLLGFALDPTANDAPRTEDARIESTGPPVLVIDTHEEWYAARACARVLDGRPAEAGTL